MRVICRPSHDPARTVRRSVAGAVMTLATVAAIASPALATTAGRLYYSSQNGTVGVANLDGSGASPSLISGLAQPYALTANSQHVFWTDVSGGSVGVATLGGSGVNTSLASNINEPTGLAIDGQHVYWAAANGFAIGRANLDGTGANPSFIAV